MPRPASPDRPPPAGSHPSEGNGRLEWTGKRDGNGRRATKARLPREGPHLGPRTARKEGMETDGEPRRQDFLEKDHILGQGRKGLDDGRLGCHGRVWKKGPG